MLPLMVPAVPFALVVGVLINESAMNNFVGWTSSWLMFAGSSQFVAISEIDAGAGIPLTVIAIWVINARHIIYSAALAPQYRDAPAGWKWLASYILTDQTFAIVEPLKDRPLAYKMAFFLGGAGCAWIIWQVSVLAGMIAGDIIPASWSLLFAVPLMFLGLMIMSISDSPGIIAAIVGGVTAVLGTDLPQGTGLLAGAFLGIIAGGLADHQRSRRTDANAVGRSA